MKGRSICHLHLLILPLQPIAPTMFTIYHNPEYLLMQSKPAFPSRSRLRDFYAPAVCIIGHAFLITYCTIRYDLLSGK